MMTTLELVKLLGDHEVEVRFVKLSTHPVNPRVLTVAIGVPKYRGFDPDIGHLFEVGKRTVALHDFEKIIIDNKDVS